MNIVHVLSDRKTHLIPKLGVAAKIYKLQKPAKPVHAKVAMAWLCQSPMT